MIKLTIGNSYSNISGLSVSEQKELKGLLSYTVGSYHTTFGPKKVSLLGKRGDFPTGLLHRVYDFLNKPGTAWQEIDGRKTPTAQPILPQTAKFYPWQVDSVKQALQYPRGTISAPTGTGKSMAMMLLLTTFNLKTLLVVPSLEIKKQMQANFQYPNLTIENIDNPKLATMTDFDMLIIDECHHGASRTYQKLNKTAWNGIYHRYCYTATPFRNNTEETLLFESIAGQVIYQLTYRDALKAGYIVPVEAYYLDCPKQETDAYTYQQVYSQLVVKNTADHMLVSNLLAKLYYQGKNTLCLVKEVAHGQAIADITGLPFVTGADNDSRRYIEQFNKGNIRVLIGTEGVLGEGIDTKPAEFVVIAGFGKAKSRLMQKVGRAVRNYPGKESAKVIILKNSSHKFLLRHFRAQCAILKSEYGAIPLKIDLD